MADGILEISQILEAYTKEVNEGIKEIAEAIGEDAVGELKVTSPKDTGKYRKGWRKKVFKEEGHVNVVIHNGKYYRLTHLLEYGHAKRNGGRTRGFVHIKPVENMVSEKFLESVEEIIRKGGS